MNPKGNKAIGIDLSGHRLTLILMEKKGKEINISQIRSVSIPWDIPSREERNAALREGLKRITEGIDVKKGVLAVGLGGQSAFVRKIKLPPVPPARIKQIVSYEVQQQIPFPLREVVWDYYLAVDKKKKEPQPMDVVMVAIKSEIVENMVSQVKQALGKEPDIVEVSVLALHNALLFNELLEEGKITMIVSIGWDFTDIMVEEGKVLAFTRSIPLGERNMLKAIINTRGGNYEEAWESLFKEEPEEVKSIWEDIVTEMKRTMNYYLSQVERVTSFEEILVHGWLAQNTSFMEFLSSRFSSTIRRVEPWSKLPKPKGITDGWMGISLGLALRPVTDVSIEINLLPPAIVKKKIFEKKKPYFILSGVLIPFVGATFSAFSYEDYTITRLKLERVKKVVKGFEPYIPKIQELNRKRKEIEGKLSEVYSILSRRTFWSTLFSEISRLTPSDTYICKFYAGEAKKETPKHRETLKEGYLVLPGAPTPTAPPPVEKRKTSTSEKGVFVLQGETTSFPKVDEYIFRLKSSPLIEDVSLIHVARQEEKVSFVLQIKIKTLK